MSKRAIGYFVFFTCLFFASGIIHGKLNQQKEANYIAIIYHNKPVYTHPDLDSMLGHLGVLTYSDLPIEYRRYTQQENIRSMLDNKKYYLIRDSLFANYIVGHFQIQDFMPKDTFFHLHKFCLPKGISQYWLMDTNLLHRFLDLILTIRLQGHNDSAITINNGYRYPKYNAKVEGAPGSQHIYGKALDVKIGDINRDGKTDNIDLEIVRQLLENKFIGNNGGIGVYKGSNIIHFDTRGYRARW